jgi:F-type H+-transporting ATPase subunit gamma
MAGGQERILRRRLRSIKSTQKITKAMELIAASQIVRAQGRIAASRPYQDGMARIVLETAMGDWFSAGRLLGTPDDVSSVLVLCVVADRGLCGGYNSNVFRATERLLVEKQEAGIETRLVTVGKKAQGYFRFRGIEVAESFLGMSERPTFADARTVAGAAVAPFVAGEVDQVIVVSTRFHSAGSQRIEVRQLLPLADPRNDEAKASHEDEPGVSRNIAPDQVPDVKHGYTEFEPDAAILLQELAPKAAETAIFAALLEASASELTARQRAMAAATENAGELIKKYSRIMNRARQETITTEIMEIVGGAEALRAGTHDDEGGLVIQTTV